jgi:thiamine-phosphate pyrophosphorylase
MALPTRIGRLRPPVLCLVIGRDHIGDREIEEVVAQAVAGGVTLVQLREKSTAAGELVDLARKLKRVTRGKALLAVNDRVDVAIAAEVDGIHLPQDGLPTQSARNLIFSHAVIGRSVHDVDGAVAAGREGADYVFAGTIYKSKSKPDTKPAGVALVKNITEASSVPVLAIGGVTVAKVDELIKAGAAGIAVISAITDAEDPKAAAAELKAALTEAWTKRAEAVAAGS